jgi:flagella basal body P-ring formation protein FlgA
MLRSLFLICLLCLIAVPCHALEITFKTAAKVDAVAITLGDIADFDSDSEMAKALATKTVGQAGQPEQDVTIDSAAIIKQLAATPSMPTDILWSGAATVTIHRTGITIGPEKIQQILDEYFAAHKTDLPEADIRYIVDKVPLPFTLPTGDLTWDVIPSDPKIIGSSRFSLIFKVDDKVRKNMSLPGHFEAMAPVAVAAVQIAKGSIVAPQHLTMATKDITKLQQPCLDLSQLSGKIALKNIKAGAVVELSAVQTPPLIKKGEVVKIILNHGNIFLSTMGVARMAGAKDEIIRVQNLNSNKILQCRVSAAGLVEVTL